MNILEKSPRIRAAFMHPQKQKIEVFTIEAFGDHDFIGVAVSNIEEKIILDPIGGDQFSNVLLETNIKSGRLSYLYYLGIGVSKRQFHIQWRDGWFMWELVQKGIEFKKIDLIKVWEIK